MRYCLLLLAFTALAQQKQPNPAFAAIEEDPRLPRVLLIGDSISIGYTLPVREALKAKSNVLRIPANGATTKNTLDHLDEWLGSGKWDVVHCNWGLHDLRIMEDGKHQVAIEEYARNLDLLFTRLKQRAWRVIFANTTPVPEGKVNPPRNPADVPRYNEAAKKVAARHGIAVNDLYSAITPQSGTLQQPVNVHFTEAGYRFLAEKVAIEIRNALPSRNSRQ